jgi:hypothetical protein
MSRVKFTSIEIQKYLMLLEETPSRIGACTADLDELLLQKRPDKGKWSAADILAHLRACDEIWSHSIYAMLIEENPTLPILAPRKWTKVDHYEKRPFHSSLQTFTLRREELLAILRPLPEEKWKRTAVIGQNTHSIFSQVRRIALHEHGHCEQMETVLERNRE